MHGIAIISSKGGPYRRFKKPRHELYLEYWTGTFVLFLIIDLVFIGLTVYVWDKLTFWESVTCIGIHAFIIWLSVSCIIDKRKKRKKKETDKNGKLKEDGSNSFPYFP